jgi:hypothetical protein
MGVDEQHVVELTSSSIFGTFTLTPTLSLKGEGAIGENSTSESELKAKWN